MGLILGIEDGWMDDNNDDQQNQITCSSKQSSKDECNCRII